MMAEGYGSNVQPIRPGGFSESPVQPPLANATRPPDPPDMDDLIRRVGKIEDVLIRLEPMIARMDERLKITATSIDLANLRTEVKADMATISGRLATDIGAINGKLTHMPTLWQIVPLMLGINAAVLGLAAWVAHLLR